MSLPSSLIPAQPGTYVLIAVLKADQFQASQANVIGWSAAGERVTPVTVAGFNHGMDEPLAVLQPDGSVEEVDGLVYTNQDEWKRAAVKRLRAAGTGDAVDAA
jgi:hypothetical protein